MVEDDLYASRDKLKEILREKLAIQNEFHSYERQVSQKLGDQDYRINTLTNDILQLTEENSKLKEQVQEQA